VWTGLGVTGVILQAAAVVLGVVLNWSWLAAAGLFRILAVLPCALTMFSCVLPGFQRLAVMANVSK
jgi:hypothetical protein